MEFSGEAGASQVLAAQGNEGSGEAPGISVGVGEKGGGENRPYGVEVFLVGRVGELEVTMVKGRPQVDGSLGNW